MLSSKEISACVRERFEAYQSGDARQVMALYADGVNYWDTTRPAPLNGHAALGDHVASLLGRFDLQFALLEEHRLEGRDAAIVLWECAVRQRGPQGEPGHRLVMQRGMSLLEIANGQVTRDEVYMDLAALDQAFTAFPTGE